MLFRSYHAFTAHIKAHAELRQRAAEYYVYGDFRDQEGISVDAPDGTLAKVYHNRAAKKVGIVVVELNGAEAMVAIESRWTPATGSVWRRSSHSPDHEILFDARLKVPLKPHEVCVLCMDLAR